MFLTRQSQQFLHVQMCLDVGCEFIEHCFDLGCIGEGTRFRPEFLNPGGAEVVRREQPVQIGSLDPAVARPGSFRKIPDMGEGTDAVGSIGAAQVDLVTGDLQAGRGVDGSDARQALVRCQHGFDIQVAEALCHPGLAFEALRIGDAAAEHLEAAALRFLAEHGDPFAALATDPQGRTAIEWGVTAPPETFILDGEGNVLHRHAGPLIREDYTNRFRPELDKALAAER